MAGLGKKKMRALTVLCLIAVISTAAATGSPYHSEDELSLMEKQYILDLAMQIAHLARVYHSPPPPKRNSELINSLLGLPKEMNDAGRK